MARSSAPRSLSVWLNGEKVGRWNISTAGKHEFCYDDAYISRTDACPISLSLPLVSSRFIYSGEKVEAFFDNLLPENSEIRQRIRNRFGVKSTSAFDLLAEIGRDCVSALQLLQEDSQPEEIRKITGQIVSDNEVAEILRGVTGAGIRAVFPDEVFRISIAGAQEKTALLFHDGAWLIPIGSTPTTHILKLPLGRIGRMGIDMSRSVENEWLCSQIAQKLDIKTAPSKISTFDGIKVLVVERFDRVISSEGNWIIRLPQEDFCQITATPSERKYEADGGPGIRSIMDILLGAVDPLGDRRTFIKSQILFWLLAAPDGHAKNFSIFLGGKGHFRLTPIYDIVSAYPVMGHRKDAIPRDKLKLAMAFEGKNRHYEWHMIVARHIRDTAKRCGFEHEVEGIIGEFVDRIPHVISEISAELPSDFPDSIATPILVGVESTAQRLSDEIS